MNKKQLEEWVKNKEYVVHSFFEYDENGNKREERIYKTIDGRLYSVSFCNNYPNPKLGDKGYMSERDENGKRIKDEKGEFIWIYEPTEVEEVKKMVETTEYIPKNR